MSVIVKTKGRRGTLTLPSKPVENALLDRAVRDFDRMFPSQQNGKGKACKETSKPKGQKTPPKPKPERRVGKWWGIVEKLRTLTGLPLLGLPPSAAELPLPLLPMDAGVLVARLTEAGVPVEDLPRVRTLLKQYRLTHSYSRACIECDAALDLFTGEAGEVSERQRADALMRMEIMQP